MEGKCEKCGHEGALELPSYEGYHDQKYVSKSYVRTPRTDPQMHGVLKLLSIQPNDTVAELGCGVGDYAAVVSELTGNYTGFDQSVSAARQRFPELGFIEADLSQSLPIESDSIDKLISIHVIEHLMDWEGLIRESYRIVKPGGIIAVATANRAFFLHDYHYDATHLVEWRIDEYERLFKPFFETIQVKKDCAMFNYYPANWILKFILKPNLTYIGRKSCS